MSEKQTSVKPRLVEQIVVTDFIDSIICGDNCDVLRRMPDECIDLVVTSPPYDDLRTYGGHSWDFYGVAWNLKRVLKPGGVIVWVTNDQTDKGTETGNSMRQALHFRELGLNLQGGSKMTLKKNRYYLKATRPCIKFQQTLQEGDVIMTMTGKPRSFGTIERALNWKMMHLGKEFPVKAWREL